MLCMATGRAGIRLRNGEGSIMTCLHRLVFGGSTLAVSLTVFGMSGPVAAATPPPGIDKIETVVVIFAENRAFDNMFGTFPGANGIANASQESLEQRDRDGTV